MTGFPKTSRYVRKLESALIHLDQAERALSVAHYHADDEHKRLGTHDLRSQTSKVRDGLSTLVDIARKQAVTA